MIIAMVSRPRRAPWPAEMAVGPGWPRRAALCAADIDSRGVPVAGRPLARSTPWAASVSSDTGAWDPWEFDTERASRMRRDDLCQVCGSARSAEVFVLAPQPYVGPLVAVWGGALCSLRCALLTAAACPHYRVDGPVGVYRVPRQDRVDLTGTGHANDDEYDLSQDIPEYVLTLPGRAAPRSPSTTGPAPA